MQEFKYLSDNNIEISVHDLFNANPIAWMGLGGLADSVLVLKMELKTDEYLWGMYYDSKRVKLQDLIRKGIKACKKRKLKAKNEYARI